MKTRLIAHMSIIMLLILFISILMIKILNKKNQEVEGYSNIFDQYHQSVLKINQNISQIEQMGKTNRDFIGEQFLISNKKNAYADSIFISHMAVYLDSIKKWMPTITNTVIKDTCPHVDTVYTDANQIYCQSANNLQVGENNQFVITGRPGDKITFSGNGNGKIYLAKSINDKGELLDTKEEISKEFIIKYPINIFHVVSTTCSQDTLIVSSINKSDTIISCFQRNVIQYQLTHHVSPCAEGYNILLTTVFSNEVVEDIYATLSVSLEINSQEKIITENILIPAGTTEYKKEIPYKISGRHPYHFDVKNISLQIESDNNIIYHATH